MELICIHLVGGIYILILEDYILNHPFLSNFAFLNQNHFPTGTIITMIVDTIIGKISFKINEGDIKTAYHALSFDEPIVPCVILYTKGDSVRLINE